MQALLGIGIWAHLAACPSKDETSPGPAMDYGLYMYTPVDAEPPNFTR